LNNSKLCLLNELAQLLLPLLLSVRTSGGFRRFVVFSNVVCCVCGCVGSVLFCSVSVLCCASQSHKHTTQIKISNSSSEAKKMESGTCLVLSMFRSLLAFFELLSHCLVYIVFLYSCLLVFLSSVAHYALQMRSKSKPKLPQKVRPVPEFVLCLVPTLCVCLCEIV
jgi:hypothetical protein